MKILFIILSIAFCLSVTSNFANAQICPEYPCVIRSTGSSEVAAAAIDNFIHYAVESKERIFVIARLSSQETNATLNLNRLCEAREELSRLESDYFKKERGYSIPVVFAEGVGIEGEGRLEFYLGSKLILTRLIRQNFPANLNCCGEFTRTEIKQKRKECIDWKKKGVSNKSMDARRKQ
jgi:hypothetical protein